MSSTQEQQLDTPEHMQMLEREQHAILIAMKSCLDTGIACADIIARIRDLESNLVIKRVWDLALVELSTGASFGEVISHTGLFAEEICSILLIVPDPVVALNAMMQFLRTHTPSAYF